MEREPDFRQGFWGDSLAGIRRKESKADEFNMEGIYAFTTYVAGLECLSAYHFTPFSTIAVFLKGEQYKVSLNIEYYSNKLEEEEREKDILKDL